MNYHHLIERGVDYWNQWRIEHPAQKPDLRGVDLSKSYLYEINLGGSNLSGANLSHACLIGADLSHTDLGGANLSGAYLSAANLSTANLSHANLTGVQVINVNFRGANLVGTCLELMAKSLIEGPEPTAKAIPLQKIESDPAAQVYPQIEMPQPTLCSEVIPTEFMQPTKLFDLSRLAQPSQSTPMHKVSISAPIPWHPALLERCQRGLSDYYISPIVTMILDDIINLDRPQTQRQFIELVAIHIPDEQEAFRFRHSALSGVVQFQAILGNTRSTK